MSLYYSLTVLAMLNLWGVVVIYRSSSAAGRWAGVFMVAAASIGIVLLNVLEVTQ